MRTFVKTLAVICVLNQPMSFSAEPVFDVDDDGILKFRTRTDSQHLQYMVSELNCLQRVSNAGEDKSKAAADENQPVEPQTGERERPELKDVDPGR